MPSKKLNARKGQILFLLSGICSQVNSLATLIDYYILDQATSENIEEHLTPFQVFFLHRLSNSLKYSHRVLVLWINSYKYGSGLIAVSNNSE